jgi:hypothetical protein
MKRGESPGKEQRCGWCGDPVPRDRPHGNYCREECRKSAQRAAIRRRQLQESWSR